MFNLTGSEIVIILLLALVILGPDKLPEAMRKAGKTWGELRKMSSSFQDEVRKGFDEPTQEIRQTASAVRKAATINTNPVKGAVKSLLDPPATSSAKPAVASSASAAVAAGAVAADAAVVASSGVEATAVDAPVAEQPATEESPVVVVGAADGPEPDGSVLAADPEQAVTPAVEMTGESTGWVEPTGPVEASPEAVHPPDDTP